MPLPALPTIPADAPGYGQNYKHFKGKFAFVLGTVIHSETGELLVVYREHDGNLGYSLNDMPFVRPLAMFLDTHSSGVKRFTKVV